MIDIQVLFAKLRLQGTKFIEAITKSRSKFNQIFIDIFPYDGCGNDEKKKEARPKLIFIAN